MIKIVVPISGGKDSQACLKLAIEHYPRDEILALYNDTGFDHPITHLHIERIRDLYGVRIEVTNSGTVPEQCRKHGRFPSGTARFCTEELKIWPSKRFYKKLAMEQGSGFEVWIGVRSDESRDRTVRYSCKVGDDLMPPHEFMRKYPKYLFKLGVMFRLPVVEWSYADVMKFLDGAENPLYAAGFDRVGCFPCLAAGDAYKELAFNFDAFGKSQHNLVKTLEQELAKSVWTSKSGIARNCGPGCALCSL